MMKKYKFRPFKDIRIYLFSLSAILGMSLTAIPSSAAEKEVCVLAKSGEKVCGKLIQPNASNPVELSRTSQSSARLEFKSGDIINVDLLKCSNYAGQVQCKFSLSRVDQKPQPPQLRFVSDLGTEVSQAVDDQGEEYIASQITIGSFSHKSHIGMTIHQGRTISATLSFPMPPSVDSIKKINFIINNPYFNNEFLSASFSDVSISR